MASRPMQMLASGEMTPDMYREIVREVFHYSRESPQLHAMAAIHFHGRERDMVKTFFNHATAEICHDQLALNDFITLGGDPTPVPYENPLPSTTALVGFAYYQMHRLNPLGFVGYIYFLEFLPTSIGERALGWLDAIGVPAGATSFLRDHAEIDMSHNKLMERYAEYLVHSDVELEAVGHAIDATGHLYATMMEQAVDYALAPHYRGWNWQELNADGVKPDDLRTRIGGKKIA